VGVDHCRDVVNCALAAHVMAGPANLPASDWTI
jgi:hypothetical protein